MASSSRSFNAFTVNVLSCAMVIFSSRRQHFKGACMQGIPSIVILYKIETPSMYSSLMAVQLCFILLKSADNNQIFAPCEVSDG